MNLLIAALFLGQIAADACAGTEPPLKTAEQALAGRHVEEAARVLAPFESGYLGCWRVVLMLGRLRYEQGDYKRANTFSELALLHAPENPAALLLRGQMLALENQPTHAQELFEKATKLDPNNAEVRYQLGMLFDANRRHREAVAEFEKVIELRPGDARAYDYLALNLEPLGQIPKAKATYQKAMTVNQGTMADPFLDYNYGRLLLKLNLLAESQKYLDRALQSAPGTRAVFYEHARLNLRLGKLREARDDGERALALADPGGFILDLQVYNLLVQIYVRLGDQESASKYARLSEGATIPLWARERR
jgi:tetratricopeptide (TPR) repeat protein